MIILVYSDRWFKVSDQPSKYRIGRLYICEHSSCVSFKLKAHEFEAALITLMLSLRENSP